MPLGSVVSLAWLTILSWPGAKESYRRRLCLVLIGAACLGATLAYVTRRLLARTEPSMRRSSAA